jgi:hypothetical protein
VGPAAAYDPRVIERFAEQLLAKADSVRVGCAVGGGIVGVLFGAAPLTGLRLVWTIPGTFGVATMLIGALVGVLIGWVIGEGRAFRYRVQAQMAYFQLEIERKVEASLEAALKPIAIVPPASPQAASLAAAPVLAPVEAEVPAPTVHVVPDPEPEAEHEVEPEVAPEPERTHPLLLPPTTLAPLRRPPGQDEPELPPLSPPVAL